MFAKRLILTNIKNIIIFFFRDEAVTGWPKTYYTTKIMQLNTGCSNSYEAVFSHFILVLNICIIILQPKNLPIKY